MAWEGEQLAVAALRRQSAHMQLNMLPVDHRGTGSGAGVSGNIRSDKVARTKAGDAVGDLRHNISKALAKPELTAGYEDAPAVGGQPKGR
ncbi:hypothetical protein [Streptomyces sp. NPDC046197]|uniref:hypothetical protein n=1 Tax=Streptomyces sp. NPDC046197 TaxID=3154337 RepID=UPI0033D5BE04